MSKYIWINPVAEKMYGYEISVIKKNLIERKYIIVECEPQLEYVKGQYKECSKNVEGTVLDCRCPETINILKKENLIDNFEVPMIEPILVRTARVLYDKYIKNNDDTLIITCTCTQLRDFATERLKDKIGMTFSIWKDFIENEGMKSLGNIEKSPIPLGFFYDSFENVLEVSSKDEIINEISKIKRSNEKKYDIVEMLYCKNGCNNGDGL